MLALAHALCGLTATIGECTTSDEIAYVTAGHVYWRDHDFRLQPENGALPQELAAVPTLVLPWHMPPVTDSAWAASDVWRLGTAAFYHLGNNTDYVLFLARALSSLHSVALMVLIFGWSYRLFGLSGGIFSGVLFAADPNFLAHGSLATSDVAAAFWLLAATGAYGRFVLRPTWNRALISGLCLGLAAVTKYSVVLLGPVWLILWALRSAQAGTSPTEENTGRMRARRAVALAAFTLAQLPIALAIIWSCYGWHGDTFAASLPSGSYYHPWSEMIAQLGPRSWPFVWLRDSGLVPQPYIYGLTNVIAFSQGRAAFLNGVVSMSGWPQFFPYAFFAKTPLPLFFSLAAAFAAVVVASRRRPPTDRGMFGALRSFAPLTVLFAIYWAASLTSHLNIGHRHLLPIYGPLYIVAGLAGKALWANRGFGRVALIAILAWSISIPIAIWPHYIAYFNPAAGGPQNGFRHLVDSSLDWGQDLPGVARWLHTHGRPDEPVALAYFGLGDPVYEGISARPLPNLPLRVDPYPNTLKPGLYVVSATMLQQVFNRRGPDWTLAAERSFQSLRALETIAHAWETPGTESKLVQARYWKQPELRHAWTQYEGLRFARLCEYLRARAPDAEIGYSILVYRVSPEQLHRALDGKLSDLVALIDETAVSNPR